jgi:hypothetical protein
MTRWAKEVSPSNALPEYPRPQMVRERWLNLNGLWDYVVTHDATPDASGNGRDGAIRGAPIWKASGGPHDGSYFEFDGKSDSMTIPSPVSKDFTIAFWLKTKALGPERGWIGGIGLVNGEMPGIVADFGTALSGNKFAFGTGAPDITLFSESAVNDGRWRHLVAVRQGGDLALYVDGKREAAGHGSTAPLTATRQLTIGQLRPGGGALPGGLSDVRIYDRALSDAEINALTGANATKENLVGWWPFNAEWRHSTDTIAWDGKILVPFPIESALSGVMKKFLPSDQLWYHRTFTVPETWKGQRLLLHFGAVDWESTVWVNGRNLGVHRGGYDGFTYDLTDVLKPEGPQEIRVKVCDPSDSGMQPWGKQALNPGRITYIAASGIWQTVWLEPAPQTSVADFHLTPDVDAGTLLIEPRLAGAQGNERLRGIALDAGREVARAEGAANAPLSLPIQNARLWSPEQPFLYDLKLALLRDGKVLDTLGSYFGMRSIRLAKDDKGIVRYALNGKFLRQVGLLDQGYWPEGNYTAPVDEAYRYDLEVLKKLGFNLDRKHLKVEPERWYYWADKMGVLVWQDMPAAPIGDNRTDKPKNAEAAAFAAPQFDVELRAMVSGRYNHPSIVQWDVFNEGFGQHDTARHVELVRSLDHSRLIDQASGGIHHGVGDVDDFHGSTVTDAKVRACVKGECGGFGLAIRDHTWSSGFWGYGANYNVRSQSDTLAPLTPERQASITQRYINEARDFWRPGDVRSAMVYTQLTDVETECNGVMTYDREVIKFDVATTVSANNGAAFEPRK